MKSRAVISKIKFAFHYASEKIFFAGNMNKRGLGMPQKLNDIFFHFVRT